MKRYFVEGERWWVGICRCMCVLAPLFLFPCFFFALVALALHVPNHAELTSLRF